MEQIQENKVPQSMLYITVLLKLAYNIQGQEVSPQGCSYENGRADCDFLSWAPPLLDMDFEPEPLYHFSLTNINGTIPAGAFSGLNGPNTVTDTYFDLKCGNGGYTRLSRGIFTPNLHWVMNLRIYVCYLENGLESRFLENLKGLILLYIRDGGIEGPVAHDALAGLTNLHNAVFRVPVKTRNLPAKLFAGLTNVTRIEMREVELNCIPPNWYDGLLNLQRVYIYDNNLRTLPPGLFDGLTSLKNIRLYKNPWDCSCGLKWLLDWSDLTDQTNMRTHRKNDTEILEQKKPTTVGLTQDVPELVSRINTHSSMESGKTVKRLMLSLPAKTAFSSPKGAISNRHDDEDAKCESPLSMQGDSLKNALSMLNCTPTTPSIRQTCVSSEIVITESETTDAVTFAAVSTSTPVLATSELSTLKQTSNNDGTGNKLRSIVLISSVGSLPLMLAIAAVLLRFGCRRYCIGGLARVNNSEEDESGPNYQRRDGTGTASTADLHPDE